MSHAVVIPQLMEMPIVLLIGQKLMEDATGKPVRFTEGNYDMVMSDANYTERAAWKKIVDGLRILNSKFNTLGHSILEMWQDMITQIACYEEIYKQQLPILSGEFMTEDQSKAVKLFEGCVDLLVQLNKRWHQDAVALINELQN
ncbi:hypothetical protein ACP70R_025186 [Stipagrostis hirtigluma subsp. patula]